MDAKTLEALKTSVLKWRRNSCVTKMEQAKIGTRNCALCKIYHSHENKHVTWFEVCEGCPVMDKTGEDGCGGTPYSAAEVECDAFDEGEAYSIDKFRNASRQMADFLEALLPEGEIV